MNNQPQIFENDEFGKIRVLEIDGAPWFVGKDVADALGYTNSRKALGDHVDDEDKLEYRFVTSGQNRRMTIINESGLYSLILSSRLPSAKKFKRWVTSEVLPSIRKHGAYLTGEALERVIQSPEFAFRLLQELLAEKEKTGALKDYVAELAPKARYHDLILQCKNPVQISIIAKDYGLSATVFNRMLYDLGIQYKLGGTWLLYQRHANKGYTKSRTYYTPGGTAVVHTYWTQKGRLFLYEMLGAVGVLPMMDAAGDTAFV